VGLHQVFGSSCDRFLWGQKNELYNEMIQKPDFWQKTQKTQKMVKTRFCVSSIRVKILLYIYIYIYDVEF
jgi:hypothetical protein